MIGSPAAMRAVIADMAVTMRHLRWKISLLQIISRVEHDLRRARVQEIMKCMHRAMGLTTRWSLQWCLARHNQGQAQGHRHWSQPPLREGQNQADHGPIELQSTDRSLAFACVQNETQGNYKQIALHTVRLVDLREF